MWAWKTASNAARGERDDCAALVHPRQHAFGHPFHDRLPDRVFGGEMAEQGALRNMHLFGNGAGCDFGRILDSGQIEYGLHRGRAAFSRRKSCA
jgi:hypothetical protein